MFDPPPAGGIVSDHTSLDRQLGNAALATGGRQVVTS
jgi:hypothetical protein